VVAGGAVLRVFRDFSYPLGVGSFNRYPIPLHGTSRAPTSEPTASRSRPRPSAWNGSGASTG